MRIKNPTMTGLVLALGLAGGVSVAYFSRPVLETYVTYRAAQCLGWKPSWGQLAVKRDVPALLEEQVQSYRYAEVTFVGTCQGDWQRKLVVAPAFPGVESVTTLRGSRGSTFILMKTEARAGMHTYVGMLRLRSEVPNDVRCKRYRNLSKLCKS